MYPLKINLVGCSQSLLPDVQLELLKIPAKVEAVFPDVDSAIDRLRHTAEEMRLFVIHLESSDELMEIRRLNSAFLGRPILALVNAGKDVSLLLNAMRNGAVQVVPLPLQMEDFRAALNCVGQQYSYSSNDGRVIAVTGVSGGCGATTLAINLAYEIAHLENVHVILAEPSPKMGVLATYLDVEPHYTLYDLLTNSKRLDLAFVQEVLTRITDNFHILAGPRQLITPMAVSSQEALYLVDYLRKLAEVVILDVPCTYDEFYFQILASCNQVVLAAEQKVPCIRTLKVLRETLDRDTSLGTHGSEKFPVINRYSSRVAGFSVGELEKILQMKVTTIANDSISVLGAVNRGKPLRLEAPQSPALADIDGLAVKMLGRNHQDAAKGNNASVLGRFARKLGLT